MLAGSVVRESRTEEQAMVYAGRTVLARRTWAGCPFPVYDLVLTD
jgi:hypothetical protein